MASAYVPISIDDPVGGTPIRQPSADSTDASLCHTLKCNEFAPEAPAFTLSKVCAPMCFLSLGMNPHSQNANWILQLQTHNALLWHATRNAMSIHTRLHRVVCVSLHLVYPPNDCPALVYFCRISLSLSLSGAFRDVCKCVPGVIRENRNLHMYVTPSHYFPSRARACIHELLNIPRLFVARQTTHETHQPPPQKKTVHPLGHGVCLFRAMLACIGCVSCGITTTYAVHVQTYWLMGVELV